MKDALDALTEETKALLEVLDRDVDMQRMTPSQPWTIADQIGHLAYFDEQAALSATDPDAFAEALNVDASDLIADVAALHRRRSDDPVPWWTAARAKMIAAFATKDPDERVPWYGPPMRARSAAIARLMETWAHGTDIADALGTSLPVTDRLFYVADLGVRTFSWTYANRGLDVPDERVRVALRGPSGTQRVWNNEADACVTGPVEEFCLVVTQRRSVADTHLVLEGGLARQWMDIAQVFAGAPTDGR